MKEEEREGEGEGASSHTPTLLLTAAIPACSSSSRLSLSARELLRRSGEWTTRSWRLRWWASASETSFLRSADSWVSSALRALRDLSRP